MAVKENNHAYRIRDIEETDRPRERLAELGSQALSNAELLAILLRVGMQGENAVQLGQRILKTLGGLHGLHRASFAELSSIKGVGIAKAAQLKAAIELGRRLAMMEPQERASITSPADAAELVRYEMSALLQEHLRVILLDTRNRVIKIEQLYIGSLNASTVRVAEIFRLAIQASAASLILVHNHPSGDPSPSPEDINLTRTVIQAGKMLDIGVLDHIIIGQNRWVSLKERGLDFS
ncbi:MULTISPECIES: DNA repair protein RadC [Anaerolinea]|jgi:DNA repair protein RadC|uniref:RadC family protein n=1 Tax=Anaerolinea TaxID=233189 RepID=UPI00261483C4|nr:DNA repair protein RadC [Anaerolinea thermophila]